MASLIYGELIKAQLQNSATDLTPVSTGLFYFNTSFGLKWYTGSVWKTAVDLDSSQTLSFKTLDGATVLTGIDLTDNAYIRLFEANTNGSNKVILRAPVNLAADYALVLPTAQAQANQFLRNDGVGNLSWAPASGGAGRNYLSDWNDASRSVGTVVTGLTSTGNRTSSQTNWGASATADLTIANNATVPLRETGDFLIDSSTTTSGAFVESPMFNLDLVDLSKAVVLSFDITGVAADGNYDVVVIRYNSAGTYQETISVAGNASSGTPASAKLPTGTTTFRGFFVSSNTQTDFYSVRIRKTAAVNDDFQIDSLFVGPQSLATGAIVTDWQSYTPTLSNSTNTTITQSLWRRVGDSMEILIRIGWSGLGAGGVFTVSTPSGYTIDTSKQNSNTVSSNFGYGFVFTSAGTTRNSLSISYNDSTSFRFYRTSGGSFTYAGTDFTTNDILAFTVTVPISQWTSNVTMADRAVEVYASNSGIGGGNANTDYTVGSVEGPSGSQFVAVNSTDSTNGFVTRYAVTFPHPILQTTLPIIEFTEDSGATWSQTSRVAFNSKINANNAVYGMWIEPRNSTSVWVVFGNSGRQAGTTYGSTGISWAGIAGNNQYRWRVRAVNGGAQVGFPIAPANITLINSADNYAGNTRLGLMQYTGGVAYNNAVTLTVSSGGALTASSYKFVPYQMADGTWRLRFNFSITLSASAASNTFTVTGVTFKNISGTAYQAASAVNSAVPAGLAALCDNNTNTVRCFSTITANQWGISGDVELESKPTWAY